MKKMFSRIWTALFGEPKVYLACAKTGDLTIDASRQDHCGECARKDQCKPVHVQLISVSKEMAEQMRNYGG
jgi:hypothetical protein